MAHAKGIVDATNVRGVRVLYAAFEPFPNSKGSGTRIRELVGGLAEAGAEVSLVTLAGPHEAALPKGVVHRPIRIAEDNFLRRAVAFRLRVARELEAARPDVVHVRGVFEGDAALDYAARRSIFSVFEVNGLPSVELAYHYRSVSEALGFQAKLRNLEERLLQRATLALTQSRTTESFLRDRGLPSSTRCVVIPNGADPSAFASERPRADPEVLRLLYAGTLAPWQGAAELLMATRRLTRTLPGPVHLTLAGPVRRRWQRELDRYLRRLKLTDVVTTTGALDRQDLAQAILASDVCVAPLRKDVRNRVQGSSPIKLFEYMAAGRALVATDLPCVREIVDHEQTGLLTASARPAALAEAIARLAGDGRLRMDLGARAQAFIRESATWQHRRDALTRAYAELLAARARA